jgi:hypothetical protein
MKHSLSNRQFSVLATISPSTNRNIGASTFTSWNRGTGTLGSTAFVTLTVERVLLRVTILGLKLLSPTMITGERTLLIAVRVHAIVADAPWPALATIGVALAVLLQAV